ncbi:MAG TPA: YrhB domain-containing protein [Burkholderiales bacterium]|nr:YrhB domain-containing protein [Burkholderiales bacterium]
MIDFETARRLVSERLARMERDMHDFGAALPDHENEPRLHLVVVKTTECDFGWVFAYDSKEYLETNDIGFAVAGNAPRLTPDLAELLFTQSGSSRALRIRRDSSHLPVHRGSKQPKLLSPSEDLRDAIVVPLRGDLWLDG